MKGKPKNSRDGTEGDFVDDSYLGCVDLVKYCYRISYVDPETFYVCGISVNESSKQKNVLNLVNIDF